MHITIFDLAVTRLFELGLFTSEGHQHGGCHPWSITGHVGENQELLLDELDFHFDVIGISETKSTNSNESNVHPSIPGYVFEYVPTPLASGGVGLFVDQSLAYNVLEKTSNEAFQALWIEIFFVNHENIVCGIIYRQHNSPDTSR